MQRVDIFRPINDLLDFGGQVERWWPYLAKGSAWRAGHIEKGILTVAHMLRDFAIAFFTTLVVATALSWTGAALLGSAVVVSTSQVVFSRPMILTAAFIGVGNAASRVSNLYRHLLWIYDPKGTGMFEARPYIRLGAVLLGVWAVSTAVKHWHWDATQLELDDHVGAG